MSNSVKTEWEKRQLEFDERRRVKKPRYYNSILGEKEDGKELNPCPPSGAENKVFTLWDRRAKKCINPNIVNDRERNIFKMIKKSGNIFQFIHNSTNRPETKVNADLLLKLVRDKMIEHHGWSEEYKREDLSFPNIIDLVYVVDEIFFANTFFLSVQAAQKEMLSDFTSMLPPSIDPSVYKDNIWINYRLQMEEFNKRLQQVVENERQMNELIKDEPGPIFDQQKEKEPEKAKDPAKEKKKEGKVEIKQFLQKKELLYKIFSNMTHDGGNFFTSRKEKINIIAGTNLIGDVKNKYSQEYLWFGISQEMFMEQTPAISVRQSDHTGTITICGMALWLPETTTQMNSFMGLRNQGIVIMHYIDFFTHCLVHEMIHVMIATLCSELDYCSYRANSVFKFEGAHDLTFRRLYEYFSGTNPWGFPGFVHTSPDYIDLITPE